MANKRTESIMIRATEEEARAISELAEKRGTNVSDLLRTLVDETANRDIPIGGVYDFRGNNGRRDQRTRKFA